MESFLSRRQFVSGLAVLGANLVIPSLAFGDELQGCESIRSGRSDAVVLGMNGEPAFVWGESSGRAVLVPQEVGSILPTSQSAKSVLMTICPEKVVNLTASSIGGQSDALNDEVNLKFDLADSRVSDYLSDAAAYSRPDVVLDIGDKVWDGSNLDGVQESLNVPVVSVAAEPMALAETYRSLGELLESERALALADYLDCLTATIERSRSSIPLGCRKRVYVGGGDTGHMAMGSDTIYDCVLEAIGAENVAREFGSGRVCVTPENIRNANPDVIVLLDRVDVSRFSDPSDDASFLWAVVPAAKAGRIYRAPQEPVSWFSGPSLYTQTVGALWLGSLVYPECFDYDMREVAHELLEVMRPFAEVPSEEEIDSTLSDCRVAVVGQEQEGDIDE